MKIIEYEIKYEEELKDLLVELQKHIVSIDKYGLNILTDDYRELYYEKTMKIVKNNHGKIFLAKDDDKAIGAIIGHIEKYDKYDRCEYSCPKKGIVDELIVSKNSRSQGIGQILLKTMEEYFKSIGCEYVSIEVFAYNEGAKQFYSKFNYKPRCIDLFKKL